jgi:hypothetical protein
MPTLILTPRHSDDTQRLWKAAAARGCSIYSRHGELQKDNGFSCTAGEWSEVHAIIERLLGDARVDLPVATVVDVGLIEGLGWAAVEQNAAWGAGIYGCDPDAVLDVLHAASGHG